MSDPAAPLPAAPAAAPVTPAEATPPEKKEAPVEVQISDGIKNLLKDRLKGKPAPKEEKKEPEKEKKDEPKKPAAKEDKPDPGEKRGEVQPDPAVEEAPAKAKVKVARRAPRSEPDIEAITTKAATAAVRAALESPAMKKGGPAEAGTPTDLDKLPETYREDIPVLKRMEQEWPDKYKGLSEKFIKSSLRIEAYRADWEKNNPGRTFDPDEAEHSAFITANDVDWNDRHFNSALADMRADAAVAKERETTGKRVEELEDKLAERDLEPAIHRRQGEVARDLIGDIDKEFVGMVEPDGRINRKEWERLRGVDKVKVDALMGAASEVAKFIDVAERLLHPSQKFKFDDKNEAHVEMAQFLINQEEMISESDQEVQFTKDGRRFATRAEWAGLSKQAQARRWRLELPDLVYLKRQEQLESARKSLSEWDDQLSKYAQSKGYARSEKPKDGKDEAGVKKEEVKPVVVKPESPSGSDGIKVDTSGAGVTKSEPDFKARLRARLKGQTVA